MRKGQRLITYLKDTYGINQVSEEILDFLILVPDDQFEKIIKV